MIQLRTVGIDSVKEDIHTKRDMGDLEELADSIRLKGVIQPITVDENLQLIAGSRRLAAARLAGLDTIPVIVRHTKDLLDAKEIELYENLHRKDLSWQEECDQVSAIHKLYQEKYGDSWGQRETAKLLDMSVGGINRKLSIAEMAEAMPEIKELPTEDDAVKAVKKMEERLILKELARRSTEAIDTMPNIVRLAAHCFRVGDAFTGIEELPDEGSTYHLIEVDPPYGIDLEEMKRRETAVNPDLDSYNEWDAKTYPDTLTKLASLLYRKAAPNCWLIFWFGPTWFCEVKHALQQGGWKVDPIPAVWCKGQGQTNSPNTVLGRGYEPFFIARKGNPSLHKQGRLNVFNYSPVAAARKYHPTQRPVELMQEIIETFSFPGAGVLVPFLGSGVTLRASIRLGRPCLGWELNEQNKHHLLARMEEDTTKEIK